MSSNTELRGLVESWVAANLAKNLDGIIEHYDKDVRAFDAVMQLQFKGRDVYRAHWQACLDMCPGPSTFEVRELQQEANGELGFGHFLAYCGGTDAEGKSQGCWLRVSQAYRREQGRWRIVHEHFSVPFDPQSGQALFELQP
ncbi:MAG TPA: nuclear transport factor 2 family protein [Pseudomonas sp.]|nr:nuclear transport factor 2 family protein [Pseudomonas sp.]